VVVIILIKQLKEVAILDKNKMYPDERLEKIMQILKKQNSAEVIKLAQIFGVTGATIRADLKALEKRNLIKRTYGGAILKDFLNEKVHNEVEPEYKKRVLENMDVKELIGKVAGSMINDGDSIMLDDGSTTLQVAKYLAHDKQVTIITNGLNICIELAEHPNANVIATGGTLRKNDLSYHGKVAEDVTSRYNADKAILGASGICMINGITAPNDAKAELKKIMIQNCRELIVIADHTKLNKISLVPVCSIKAMTTLITDSQADPEFIKKLESNNIKVVIADLES